MLGEFPQYIFALVERVGCLTFIEPFLVPRTVGRISAETPVRIEVTGGHTTETETCAIHVIACDGGIDRPEVELAGVLLGARFHEVLNQGFRTEDDIFESGNLLNAVHEDVHVTLFLCEGNLTHTRPIFITLVEHVGFFDDVAFQAEETRLNVFKVVIGVFGSTLHFKPLYAFYELQFHGHVIVRKYPVSVRHLLELLHYVEVVHKVHTGLFGQVHGTLLDGIGRILHYVEVSRETEIL